MNYSESFKNSLIEINDDISNFLLTLENTEQDIDDVDLSNTDGYISYTKDGRETKNKMKVGRFVSRLTENFTARQIELFSNSFKSISKYNKIKERFYLGSGKADFKFAYSTTNYSSQSGSLGNSCMNNSGDNRLRLYSRNPKKVNILMLKDDNGKVLARAVVWKNAFIREGDSAEIRNENPTIKGTVVDRVYSTLDYHQDIFKKYAQEKGWYFRVGGMEFIRHDGERVKCRLKLPLKNFEYNDGSFPYLDTMRSISKKGTISNKRWKEDVRFY